MAGRALKLTSIGCGVLVVGFVLLFAVVVALTGGGGGTSSPPERAEKRKGVEQLGKEPTEQTQEESGRYDAVATVIEAVDGDTVKIEPTIDGEEEVHFIGVDTPETEDPDEGVEPYGEEATNFTKSVLEGEEVELEFDAKRKNQSGRLLAYVYPMGEEMFNEDLLEQGNGQLYTVSPNTEYEDRFEAAQEDARRADLGIWGLTKEQQCKLANHGNGIGEGSPGCGLAKKPAPSGDIDCSQVEGPVRVPPGDPNNLDPDGDGWGCEESGGTASPEPQPNRQPNRNPNRNYDSPGGDYNAPGTATSTASPGGGGGLCPQGGYPVPPGDPRDGDDDGCAGE
jgi:micrococcal nuclease